MQKMHLSLAISLMIVSLIIGLAGGYFVAPVYQQTMYQREEMGLGKADSRLDLRYINAMIQHHLGAILLARQIATRSERSEIQALANEIQTEEPKAIAELYKWKKEWYNDTSLVKNPVVANLGPADDTTDLRFLNAIIAHHETGTQMTKEVRTKTTRKEILDNADAVENFLQGSIISLKTLRSEWYNVN